VLAKNSNLIDKIAYYDEYIDGLKYAMNVVHADDIQRIKIADYAIHTTDKLRSKSSKQRIAVIFAEGDIIYGEGDENSIGQGTMSMAFKEAREDDKVKSIVLRINSPGGDALEIGRACVGKECRARGVR